jgi:dTDP-4-amino-4,6-dideoxygalactose transaminase
MHLQPVFSTEESMVTEQGARKLKAECTGSSGNKPYKIRVVGGEVSEYLFERGLCLPSGTQMSEQDLDRIVRIIKNVHGR